MITHPELVKALKKDGQAIIDDLTPEKADAWHMASGAHGESGELLEGIACGDFDNMAEELGDIEFFVEGVRSIVGLQYEAVVEGCYPGNTAVISDKNSEIGLVIATAKIFDAIKRWVIYNKELDREVLIEALREYEFWMNEVRKQYGLARSEVLDANIAKLSKRYKKLIYSNEAAQARADKNA